MPLRPINSIEALIFLPPISIETFCVTFFKYYGDNISDFGNLSKMADWSGERFFMPKLSRAGIFISARPMSTKLAQPVHLEKLTHLRLLKQPLVTSSLQGHSFLRNRHNFLTAKVTVTEFG